MIKIISFCTAKKSIHKTKRTSEQEKIFANNVTNKGFSSKIYKQLYNIDTNNPIKKGRIPKQTLSKDT